MEHCAAGSPKFQISIFEYVLHFLLRNYISIRPSFTVKCQWKERLKTLSESKESRSQARTVRTNSVLGADVSIRYAQAAGRQASASATV